MTTTIMTKEGLQEISVMRINNCVNGNPRYVVHFLALGLKEYKSNDLTRQSGLKLYRGKKFGGGFVFSSYNVKDSLQFAYDTINNIKIGTTVKSLSNQFAYRENAIIKDLASIEINKEVPEGYYILRFYDSKGNGFEGGKTPNGYSVTN